MKCAFMNRECNPECVAWVPTEGGDPREGYHFTFPCICMIWQLRYGIYKKR